jgi:hypothetical protein
MKGRTGRYVLASACVLAVGVPSLAVAAGEGDFLRLGQRNPSGGGSLTAETEVIAENGTYGTRQSNKRDGDGGGAIYGCRSNPGTEPCIRANNLKGGRAFELVTVGSEAGRIETGNAAGAPFTTNATGVATGLNADRVDGRDGADLDDAATLEGKRASEFAATGDLLFGAVVNGALTGGRGADGAGVVSAATSTYYVDFNRDVSKCSFTASPLGGQATAEALAVQPAAAVGGESDRVRVDAPEATDFHVQVIC